MLEPASLPAAAYLAVLALVAPFGLHRLWLVWLRLRPASGSPERRPAGDLKRVAGEELPAVTVQLPVYDEAAVVERAIDAACRLDWPRDRLEVQVLDDSDDETTRLAARRVARWRDRGVDVRHLRRGSREGYKAGALAHGVERARGELFLVLDADFVPPRDLLRRLVPSFRDPDVGFVQAAWDHLNERESWLTLGQATLLDAHFAVEHAARHRAGLFFNFNGTAGMWRRSCLQDVGGWSGATLTEDLELSYRAQAAGWRGAYRDDVRVPAELPSDLRALEVQQERWARGGLQTARRVLPGLWRTDLPLRVKLEASAHLAGHLIHPLTLMLAAALAWPARLGGAAALVPDAIHLAALAVAVVPFLLYYGTAVALRGKGGDRGLGRILSAVTLGIGLSPPLAAAGLRGLLDDREGVFRRTPKTGAGMGRPWLRYLPASRPGRTAVRLLLGGALATAAVRLAAAGLAGGVPFTLLFAAAFLGTGAVGLRPPVGGQESEGVQGEEDQHREMDGGGQRRRVRPDPGRPEDVQAGVGEEDGRRPEHPGPSPLQRREGQHPEQVPGMDRGRQEEGGAGRPEERPLEAPAARRGRHGEGGRDGHGDPTRRGLPDAGGQHGEERPVEGPPSGVLAQAGEEGGPGA